MNWDALGAIGAVIGAIAVAATLVYLSIQTRLTRKAVEESSAHAFQQATHAAVGMYSDWRRAILGTPELAQIIVKGRTGELLAPDARLLHEIIFQDLFLAAAVSYRGVLHHAAGHEESISVTHMIAVLTENPLAVEDWVKTEPVLVGISSEFVAAVNAGLQEAKLLPNITMESDA